MQKDSRHRSTHVDNGGYRLFYPHDTEQKVCVLFLLTINTNELPFYRPIYHLAGAAVGPTLCDFPSTVSLHGLLAV